MDNKKTFSKISLAFIAVSFIAGLLYLKSFSPNYRGDWKEYLMQLSAFENHFSFGITEKDIEKAQLDFALEAEELGYEYYVNPSNHLHEYKDAKYSNHFGSYSALAMPAKKMLTAFGKYPLWAFFITNYLLYATAVLTVFFGLKIEPEKKFFILLLSVFNPAIFYLDWIHSEVYLYSFVVIGLVFLYNKHFRLSVLFFSIAAMQNLAIVPFEMMVGINYVFDLAIASRKEYKTINLKHFVKKNWWKVTSCGLCYIPALISPASTYYKFHTINLVKDVRMENKYIVHKAIDYLFDLNLGILPYEPVILLLFIAMILIGLKKKTMESAVNLLGVLGILYVVSNQIQINCDMQFIMRYNVWIIPIMIFFVVAYWDEIIGKKKIFRAACISEALITFSVILFVFFGNGFTSNQFAPWTKKVIEISPSIYNPTHGIFYSRVAGEEIYFDNKPVEYYDGKGRLKKVLLSNEAKNLFYSDEFKVFDESGDLIDKEKLKKIVVDEREYTYININKPAYGVWDYNLGDSVVFSNDGSTAGKYFYKGLSHPEEWGAWTDGDEIGMRMYVDDPDVEVHTFIDVSMVAEPLNIVITVNGNEVYKDFINSESPIEFDFDNDSNIIDMKICIPELAGRKSASGAGDSRILGLGIREMILTKDCN